MHTRLRGTVFSNSFTGHNFAKKFYEGQREPAPGDHEEQARFRLMLVSSLVNVAQHSDGSGKLLAAAISTRLGLVSSFKCDDEEVINSIVISRLLEEYDAFSCTISMDSVVHR